MRRAEQMMVCRRWRVWALLTLAGMMPPVTVLAAGVTLPKTARDMESAHGDDAVTIRETIEAAHDALSTKTLQSALATAVAVDFTAPGLGVNSTNPDARLNSAILIAHLEGLNTDTYQESMLGNADPAVRFWAARGLGKLAADLKAVGADAKAVAALEAAIKVEKSGVVIQEIIKSLAIYGDPAAIRTGLKAVIAQISTSEPDVEMLRAAEVGLNALAPSVASENAKERAESASIGAQTASLAAQQTVAFKAAREAVGQSLPKGYFDAARDVAAAAAKVAGAAASKSYPAPTGTSPDELLLNVNGLFGTPGTGGGTLQKDIPGVSPPPVAKSGSAP